MLAAKIHKDYRRSLRADRRMMRRQRQRREGGWIYRTFLYPDPALAIGGYLLVLLAAVFFALLIYGQVTHGGDPLWWARLARRP